MHQAQQSKHTKAGAEKTTSTKKSASTAAPNAGGRCEDSGCHKAHEKIPANPTKEAPMQCRQFNQKGGCQREECRFAHVAEEQRSRKPTGQGNVCRDFNKGHCFFGKYCRFPHELIVKVTKPCKYGDKCYGGPKGCPFLHTGEPAPMQTPADTRYSQRAEAFKLRAAYRQKKEVELKKGDDANTAMEIASSPSPVSPLSVSSSSPSSSSSSSTNAGGGGSSSSSSPVLSVSGSH